MSRPNVARISRHLDDLSRRAARWRDFLTMWREIRATYAGDVGEKR